MTRTAPTSTVKSGTGTDSPRASCVPVHEVASSSPCSPLWKYDTTKLRDEVRGPRTNADLFREMYDDNNPYRQR